jgi:hypothetical protein
MPARIALEIPSVAVARAPVVKVQAARWDAVVSVGIGVEQAPPSPFADESDADSASDST